METITYNLEELPQVVEQLLSLAGKSRIILFSGEIGAGKTTLIKELCHYLGVGNQVSSPTFSLINEYVYLDKFTGKEKLICHADLYRLNSTEEVINIGLEDYLYQSDYCLIEWPELINSLLPADVIRVHISILENSSRKIVLLQN